MADTNVTIATILSSLVLMFAVAGLIVAIVNVRKQGIDCGVHSLSVAYIIFFILAVLASFGVGGALFKGTEMASTAGITLLTFISASLFVLATLLFLKSGKIDNGSLKRTNYAIFGIFAAVSLINILYLFYQRENIIESQPVSRVMEFIKGRFDGMGMGNARVSPAADYSPVRVQ